MSDFSFKGADGQVYRLSAMTFKDRSDLRSYVQFREYHEFAKLKDGMPADDYKTHSQSLLMLGSKKSGNDIAKETDQFLESPDGIAYTVYLHLRRFHADITPDKVSTLIDLDNLPEIGNAIQLLNPVGQGEPTAKKK